MSKIESKLDLRGFKAFRAALGSSRVNRVIQKNMRRRTQEIGLRAQKAVRYDIRSGEILPPLAGLTLSIKSPKTKPLVDRGDLWQAVTSKVIDWSTVFVGVLQSNGVYNIAKALHDGVSITVTQRMRNLFFLLWLTSFGKRDPALLADRAAEIWARVSRTKQLILPIADTTSTIVIPSRPFIRRTFEQEGMAVMARQLWEQGLQDAMNELADLANNEGGE